MAKTPNWSQVLSFQFESINLQRWQSPQLFSQTGLLQTHKPTISKDIPEEHFSQLLTFLERVGVSGNVPEYCNAEDFYFDIIGDILNPLTVLRGRVTCLNSCGGFFGGVIAAVAEAVSFATARTVVAEDKELFLGELSISYLSSAPKSVSL